MMMASKEKVSSAKQNDKTIDFWDTFYKDLNAGVNANEEQPSNNNDLEWIVSDKPVVLDKILSFFPITRQPSMHILEIGCGVSQLSRSLLERMIRQQGDEKAHHAYEFVSTDVSLVCLQHNRDRDAAYIASLPDTSTLSYTELNVVKELPACQMHKYDAILDKGTCDTFLFRSKRTQKGSAAHAPLLKPLLNNVHRLLRSGCKAKYIIISPRSKLKSVRDFNGFVSVNRTKMSTDLLGDAVLVKGNAAHKPAHVFIYECTRNDSYQPDKDEPFADEGLSAINDDTICKKCQKTFKEFRGNVDIQDQGVIQWTRRFRNHIIHCTGTCNN
mmetsp:Transcript_18387/g.36865  ORF Transcript_18387/g.36865 Transcript_18387/m.36865 type:complete len:328 (+) Transcript_18387:156-1139(+)